MIIYNIFARICYIYTRIFKYISYIYASEKYVDALLKNFNFNGLNFKFYMNLSTYII